MLAHRTLPCPDFLAGSKMPTAMLAAASLGFITLGSSFLWCALPGYAFLYRLTCNYIPSVKQFSDKLEGLIHLLLLNYV